MALTVPPASGQVWRTYRITTPEACGTAERVKLALPAGTTRIVLSGVWVEASTGAVTRVDPALFDAESGGTRLWLGRWGSVTPGLVGEWLGEVGVPTVPAADGVWFQPGPDAADGLVAYIVMLRVQQ